MKCSKELYEDVAIRCSEYDKTSTSPLSNTVDNDCTSCLNCRHFAKDEHCVLDLFDQIRNNL